MSIAEYLTIGRARELILQRFTRHTRVPRWKIINHVEAAHGRLSANEKQIVDDALRSLRERGLADNPEWGYWSF